MCCCGQWGQADSADAQLHRNGSSCLAGGQDAVSIVSVMLLTKEIIPFMRGWKQTVVQESVCMVLPSAAGGVTACLRDCSDPRANILGAEPRKGVCCEHSCDIAGQRFIL